MNMVLPRRREPGTGVAWTATVLLALLHGGAILAGMGGIGGLSGPYPLARHDHPTYYAAFGMLPYLLAIPLALPATACIARFLEQGGRGWWLASAALTSLVVLVHLTSAMIVAPAAALAYATAVFAARREGSRLP